MKFSNILAGILLIVSVIIMSISGCKKFEEDPELIHLRTVKKRIEGLKEITQHTIGNTDVNAYWHQRFGDFYLDFSLDKSNPHKSSAGYMLTVYEKGTNNKLCDGEWWFFSSEQIEFHFNCLNVDTTSTWPERIHGGSGDIIRLSNKEMRLRNEVFNDEENDIAIQEVIYKAYEN